LYNKKPSITKLLNDELKAENLHPVYLFYGSEDFLKDYYQKAIINKILGRTDDFNITEYTEENFKIDHFLDDINNVSMLSPSKVIILRNIDTGKLGSANRKALIDVLSDLPQGVTVFLYYDGLYLENVSYDLASRRKKELMALSKTAFTAEINTQEAESLLVWIKRLLKSKGTLIDDRAADLLLQTAGSNMSNLKTEIEKLALYKGNDVVRVEDIEKIVSKTLEANIFNVAENLLKGKSEDALKTIKDCREAKEEPIAVLSNIASSFYEATIIKAAQLSGVTDIKTIIRDFGLNSRKEYFFRKYAELCRGLDFGFFKNSMAEILNTDKLIKESRNDKWQAIELMCIRIMKLWKKS